MNNKMLIKYYRLSQEDPNPGESESIANQRKQVEDYVENHVDLNEMDSMELLDDGYTGTNFNRPGIIKFFELLRKNKVGCLIVKDFSRFSRDYIDMGNYLEQIFPFMNVRFISINDGYDSALITGENSLEISFKGILNDLYSKDIAVKAKAAKRQMIKQGKLCSGSYPFGYIKSEKGKCQMGEPVYMIDHDAAVIIRYIFKLALEGKKNIEIARELNIAGYPSPAVYKKKRGGFGYGMKEQESVWDSTKVLTILRDERYKGTLIIGRYQSAGVGSGKVVKAPEEMWFRKEHAIPAIVSEEDFEKVQILRPYQKRGKYKREHHLLYRKIKCGCCGRYMYYKRSESGEQYHSFFCKQNQLNPNSQCFKGYVKEKEILEMLLCLIQKQVELAGELNRESRKERPDKAGIGKKMKFLAEEIELGQAYKAQNYMKYRDGNLTKEQFLEQKILTNREIEKREAEIAVLVKNVGDKLGRNESVEGFGRYQMVKKPDREMIGKLVDTIWVFDVERVKVDLKYQNIESENFYSPI